MAEPSYRPVKIASGATFYVPGGLPEELDDRIRTARTGDEVAEMIRAHRRQGEPVCDCTGAWTQTVHISNPEGHQVGCPRWGARPDKPWPPPELFPWPVAVKRCVFRTCDWTIAEPDSLLGVAAMDAEIKIHLRTHRVEIELLAEAIQ